jgi:hypothetical protein
MSDHSKSIKRLLRQWMTEAYERELHRELTRLDQTFAEWRAGKMSSGELSYRIHQSETGASRELFKHYNNSPHEMSVAYAVVTGILKREELPADLLEAIERELSFFQELKDRHELREPRHYLPAN